MESLFTSGVGIVIEGTSTLPAVLGRLMFGGCRGMRGEGGRPLYTDECPFVNPFPLAANCGGVNGRRRPLPKGKCDHDVTRLCA